MIAKLARLLKHFIVLCIVCLITSGCVKYDVGVQFDSPNGGAIVQKIQLDDRLLTSGTSQTWLANIEQRTRKLQGKIRKVSSNEIIATIPFSNGQDLEKKFNEFFSTELAAKVRGKKSLELPQIDSKFVVQQGNFIVLERTRLIYDIDLRSLGIATDSPISPNSLLDLQFSVEAPWGAQSLNRTKNGVVIPARRNGKQLIWTLQPGVQNHIETAFWMPNPLGIGALVIAAIVAAGIFFKKQQPVTVS
ncbi:MAG: DUF3153 domain-containing protein [Leptolyngbya sp. UWPOB_LEPTO1]|uniref:DUF3153 domain-containing protein n=1 Tax=Leptolyngbya sp. UWPOB_LEPTO1 TaxID=2815653 RepID=UPI001AC7ED6C|nr:DUF3153 domain-containing protein [Leptolyngbya sp. UWPOB_LEPTO1]MBN8561951.1 DUF3153 domain-containing protein [Leptolyngbya sp. UWPOB_LEPTO1]